MLSIEPLFSPRPENLFHYIGRDPAWLWETFLSRHVGDTKLHAWLAVATEDWDDVMRGVLAACLLRTSGEEEKLSYEAACDVSWMLAILERARIPEVREVFRGVQRISTDAKPHP